MEQAEFVPSAPNASSNGFVPAQPGTWLAGIFVEANHEAAHCLAAYLLSVEVSEVRVDRPDLADPLTLGYVVDAGAADWRALAITMSPLINEGRCPTFPPSEVSDDGDEVRAAELYRAFHLAPDDWDMAVNYITTMFRARSCKRMLTALSQALLDHHALTGADAFQVLKDAEQHKSPTDKNEGRQ